MVKKFPNPAKEIDNQVQEAQRFPNKKNPKRPTTRHMIIKMSKFKGRENLNSSKRKTTSHNQQKKNNQY